MKRVLAVAVLLIAETASAQVVTDRNRADALRRYRDGDRALRAEAYDKAEREFHEASRLDPTLDLAFYGLGQVYMATRHYLAAVRAYRQCREAFRAAAIESAENEALRQQRIDDHIRALEDAKADYSSGRYARSPNIGATIVRLEMQIEQLRLQRLRADFRPEGTPAWISLALGSAYFRTNAMDDAEHEFREALSAEPNLGEAHNNLAVVFMLTERYEDAEREVVAAESAGFRVNPDLKRDIAAARK